MARQRKARVMYAIFVNDELYPESLCERREWAESYLDDARHAAAKGAAVRVVQVTIEELPDES